MAVASHRRRRQRSREAAAAAEGQRDADGRPELEIGAADRELGAKIREHQRSMRASSAPIEGPGVRRLEAGLGAREPLRPAALPAGGPWKSTS